LRGAALYYDGQITFAERLAVENAVDARDHGTDLRLYSEVDEILVLENRVLGVAATDKLTGSSFEARAPIVVNAAGAWVDAVLGGNLGKTKRLMGGTKGSHLVVAPFPGAPTDALYVEAARDGRPYFIVPWNGQYLIGTTDERYEGDLDRVVASEDEIAYLLEETNRVVPGARLDRPDVLWTYAGVRPLPHRPAGATGAITRRHVIHDHGRHGGPQGLLSIVGGKLTTYRALAEQTVDKVGEVSGRRLPRSTTTDAPLPGARQDGTFPLVGTLGPRTADHLRRVYGAAAGAVVARAISRICSNRSIRSAARSAPRFPTPSNGKAPGRLPTRCCGGRWSASDRRWASAPIWPPPMLPGAPSAGAKNGQHARSRSIGPSCPDTSPGRWSTSLASTASPPRPERRTDRHAGPSQVGFTVPTGHGGSVDSSTA
jgi:glycerol-3-phosphate dehydrogenase